MYSGKPIGRVKEGFLCGNPTTAPFVDLEDFYNRGQLAHLEEFAVYEPAELLTRILIPIKGPDYPRASVEEAFSALMLTPDPDFVARLILADHLHPLGPWIQQTQGMTILSESSEEGTILLYRPGPNNIRQSVTYEWCNLLRLYHSDSNELFSLTATLEDFIDLETGRVVEDQRVAWNLLGSLLIREKEATVFALCVRFPIKCAIWGRTLLRSLLDLADFRQTENFPFFLDRAKFIDFSASKVGLDVLQGLPDKTELVERLIQFLGEQELLKSLRY